VVTASGSGIATQTAAAVALLDRKFPYIRGAFAPDSVTVTAGKTTSSNLSVQTNSSPVIFGGFPEAPLPAGVTWSVTPLAANTWTFVVSTTTNAAPGTYPIRPRVSVFCYIDAVDYPVLRVTVTP